MYKKENYMVLTFNSSLLVAYGIIAQLERWENRPMFHHSCNAELYTYPVHNFELETGSEIQGLLILKNTNFWTF